MCTTTARAELLLPQATTSPRAAREFAIASGCTEHALAVLDDALLIITELVTNAVKHGAAPILLAIECEDDALRVRVRDGATGPPQPRVASDDDEGGRGLTLVELLTDAWGVEAVEDEHGPGKAVWFQLRTSR
jgi:anti-sigma regulatory factor (Ser/Thr protein kinase)